MYEIIEILGAGFGDGVAQYKESAYELIRTAYPKKRLTPKQIDWHVKKYVEYGLMTGVKDTRFRGYRKWKITDKGIRALDYYRNARGYRDLSEGVIS